MQSLCTKVLDTPNLLHELQSLGNCELGIRLAAYLLDFDTRSQLSQYELAGRPVDLEDTLHSWLARETYLA